MWLISFNRKFWIKWQKTTGKRKKHKKKDGCKENSGFVLIVNLFLKAVQVVDGNTVFFFFVLVRYSRCYRSVHVFSVVAKSISS